MPERKLAILGGLIAVLWTLAPASTLAQVRPIRPPMVAPPPIHIPPRLDIYLGGSLRVTPTPRLDPSLPHTGGPPVLDPRFAAPSNPPREPVVPAASQPNYEVKDPPPPAHAPPDADHGTPETTVGVPSWVIWGVLAVAFFLYLSRKER